MWRHTDNRITERGSTMERFRITTTGEFIASIPASLGFRPHNSVVVTALADGLVGPSVRVDLPPTVDHVDTIAMQVVAGLMRGSEFDAAIVSTWLEFNHADVGQATSTAITAALHLAGKRIGFCAIITGDEFWSWSPDGWFQAAQPVPWDSTVVALLDAEGRGSVVRSREDVVALVKADPIMAVPIDPVPEGVDLDYCMGTLPTVTALLTNTGLLEVDPREVTRLAHACNNVTFRDGLVIVATDGALDLLANEEAVRILTPLTQLEVTPPNLDHATMAFASLVPDQPEAVNLLTVLGVLAWAGGNGISARALLDRALAIKPDHPLAGLTLMMVDNGIRNRRPGRAS